MSIKAEDKTKEIIKVEWALISIPNHTHVHTHTHKHKHTRTRANRERERFPL